MIIPVQNAFLKNNGAIFRQEGLAVRELIVIKIAYLIDFAI